MAKKKIVKLDLKMLDKHITARRSDVIKGIADAMETNQYAQMAIGGLIEDISGSGSLTTSKISAVITQLVILEGAGLITINL